MATRQTQFEFLDSLDRLDDAALQSALLQGVSRTFALTIPQLPDALYPAVANAYLLCRIVDTIEDEVSLSPQQKQTFCRHFIDVVKTGQAAFRFSDRLSPLLSSQTLPAEHALIALSPRVIAMTHRLHPEQIAALAQCVETMANGMPQFQAQDLHGGLPTLHDMDRYCYYVAGCVGEMLAKLFCHYSPEMARHRERLLTLAVSFGQGLQMTNILKDIWDDAARGVCWLPRDIFDEVGYELRNLSPTTNDERFQAGLVRLVGIAQGHLHNALRYTLLIPPHEIGLRNFCLWALGMALLTLRKIRANPGFTQSSQVKISRRQVKATVLVARWTGRHDALLSLLFRITSLGLGAPAGSIVPKTLKPSQK